MYGVNMLSSKFITSERAVRYATAASFFEIYNEEMNSLLLLSIVLTADPEKAEQCFVSGLDECLHGIDVFMEWARLWARRAIIKHAIKLINPVPAQPKPQLLTGVDWRSTPKDDNLIGAIFALGAFERFVFVMSLLERQSDEECATLLSCRRRDIESARAQALKRLPDSTSGCNPREEALQAWRFIRAQQNTRSGQLDRYASSLHLPTNNSKAGTETAIGLASPESILATVQHLSISSIRTNQAATTIRKELL